MEFKKLKVVKAETNIVCEKCIGYESDEKCDKIMIMANDQGLHDCFYKGNDFIYLEDA